MTEKMKSFIDRTKYNAKYFTAASATGTLLATSAIPVSAAITLNEGSTNDTTADSIVSKIIEMIAMIARYIGIVLLAWGVVQLVLAFKNEDADSKSRAMMLIIVSIALIAIKTFINLILSAI